MTYELPHVMVPGEPTTDRFQRRGGGGGGKGPQEIRERQAHASALSEGLREMSRQHRNPVQNPLYTMSESTRIVDVLASTFRTWARKPPEPIITTIKGPPRSKRRYIPFVGLTEAMVLAAIRKSGVPMLRTRPALEELFTRGGCRVKHVRYRYRPGETVQQLTGGVRCAGSFMWRTRSVSHPERAA